MKTGIHELDGLSLRATTLLPQIDSFEGPGVILEYYDVASSIYYVVNIALGDFGIYRLGEIRVRHVTPARC